jgi:protocatechuate 3,4-dioxygenase beta subunit
MLSVQASGFAPLALPNLVVPAGAEPWDLGTAFLKAGAALEGLVVEKDGSPVSGARVRVLPEETEKGRPPTGENAQVATNEDGRFILADQLAGMPCRLEILASGFLPVLTPAVVPPTSEPVTVVLAPSSQVSGTVLAGGNPVGGAVVVAAMQDGVPLSSRRFYTVSDTDGRFLLEDLEPGNLALTASAEGYAESHPVLLSLPAEERRDGVEIHLTAGGTVSGIVSSKAGTALEGTVIEAFPEDNGANVSTPSRRKVLSDHAGRFRLAGLQPGAWLFSAIHPEFARKVTRRQIGSGDHPLDFVLASGSEISGLVTDEDNQPLPGVQILLIQEGGGATQLSLLPAVRQREAISQANGSFQITGVEDGSYRLRALKAGLAPTELAETLSIASAPVEGIVLRLKQGSSISGRLLGLPYDELARIKVFAFRTDGGSAQGEIDPTGGYHILDLEPGQWGVVAKVEETGKRAIGEVLVGREPANLDLDFANGFMLSGILRVDGRPTGGAVVRLRSPKNGGASVTTQIEGVFRFTGLAKGSYSFEVPATGLRHVEEIDLSSDREVHLDLTATAINDRARKSQPLVVEKKQQPRDL